MEATEHCSNCGRDVKTANFTIHSAFCERKIQLCKLCNEPVQRTEMDDHKKIYHIQEECTDCGMPMEKWMLWKHKDSCPKRLVTCKFCDMSITFDELEEHSLFCGSRTEQCSICKHYVLLREKESHPEFCLKVQGFEENISSISKCADNKSNVKGASATIDKIFIPLQDIEENNASEIPSKNFLEAHAVFRSGECPICHQSIPWIDMNVHVPSCSSASGRCSGCGEHIPTDQLKNHVMQYCSKILTKKKAAYDARTEKTERKTVDGKISCIEKLNDDKLKSKCFYCDGLFDLEIVRDHMKSCPQGALLHLNSMQEGKQLLHQPRSMLQEDDKNSGLPCYGNVCETSIPVTYSRVQQDSMNRETEECPSCCRYIPKIRFEPHIKNCKKDPPRYEDTFKAQANMYQVSLENKTVICNSCRNEMPAAKLEAHFSVCRMGQKICNFCNDVYFFENESSHIKNCKKVNESPEDDVLKDKKLLNRTVVNSKYEHCPYCENMVAIDSYPDHLEKCFEKQKYKTTGSKSSVNSNEHESGLHSNEWIKTGAKQRKNKPKHEFFPNKKEKKKGISFLQCISPTVQKQSHARENTSDEIRLPCEFCEKLFSPEYIIEHQSGCRPDLVSFPKDQMHNECQINAQIDKYTERACVKHTSISRCTNPDVLDSMHVKNIKFNCADVIPGEFLHMEHHQVSHSHGTNFENPRFRQFSLPCGELNDSSLDDKSKSGFVIKMNAEPNPDMNNLDNHSEKQEVIKKSAVFVRRNSDNEDNSDLSMLLHHCTLKNSNVCSTNNLKSCTDFDLLSRNSMPPHICKMCKNGVCLCEDEKSAYPVCGYLGSEPIKFATRDAQKETMSYNQLNNNQDCENVPKQDEEVVSGNLHKTSANLDKFVTKEKFSYK